MSLFRLTLTTILTRKTFIVFAVMFLVLPLFLPVLVPWEEKPQLLEPARAQTAWGFLWLVAIGWVFHQGASFGDRWSAQGVLEYVRTLGTGKLSQLFQLWLSCLAFLGFFLAAVIGICLLTAMPADAKEASAWVVTNLQFAILFLLVVAPLLLLAIALGTRVNVAAAYVITAAIAVYGLYGMTFLKAFMADSGSSFFDVIYVLSPHYHVADLTTRLVYKMGALHWSTFFNIVLYLAGIGSIVSGAAMAIYREKK